MLAILFSLVSSVAYGVSDFYGAVASRKAHPVVVSLINHLVALATVGLALFLIPGVWQMDGILAGAGCGVFESVGFLLFYASMTMGPVSIIAPVVAVIYAIVPVAWAIAHGEVLSALAWWGVVLGCVSVIALSIGPGEGAASDEERASAAAQGKSANPSRFAILLGVVAGILWGFATVSLDYAPVNSGIIPAFAEMVTAVVVLSLIFVVLRRRIDRTISPRAGRLAVSAGVLFGAANALLLLALANGPLALVAMLVSLYPLSTVLLARFTLKEHISWVQWIGIGGALGAVVLIGVGY